jgi:hypothetical protein
MRKFLFTALAFLGVTLSVAASVLPANASDMFPPAAGTAQGGSNG